MTEISKMMKKPKHRETNINKVISKRIKDETNKKKKVEDEG